MAQKVLIALVVAAALGTAYYFAFVRQAEEGPQPVRTTGIVEALEINVAAEIAGRLEYVGFREGEAVRAGELLARIDDSELMASLSQAEALAKSAKASLASGYDDVQTAGAQVGVAEAEVESSKAALERSGSQLELAEKDHARASELYEKGIISRSAMDEAETLLATRRAEHSQAKANLALAGSALTASRAALAKAEGNIKTLKAKLAEAESGVRLREAQLGYTKIFSHADAVVEYRSLEPGEVVSPGTSIMTLVDLSELWVRMDLEEGYIARVKAGDKAEITLERLPAKVFEGEVYDIGRQGRFAVERDVTRGRQDIKTFRTKVRVEDPEGILKPGMTAIVTIPVQ